MDGLIPAVGLDSREFWEACARKELRMQRCTHCQTFRFPPRGICPSCLSTSAEWALVSGRGRVWSYAVVHHPFHAALSEKVPYLIAIVELEEGVRLASNIANCPLERVQIGMAVSVLFQELAPGVALPVFEPSPGLPRGDPAQEG